MTYHRSVLVHEVVHYLHPMPDKIYIDATFGGGGHTRAILLAEPACHVIACDWDEQALIRNGPALQEEFPGRLELIWTNFAQLLQQLKKRSIIHVDGILADFGTSQFQIQQSSGFSFDVDTPLDMRMSPAHHRVTAAVLINQASVEELAYIFWTYGEERYARQIAEAIIAARPLQTTKQLADLVIRVIKHLSSRAQRDRIHPATRVFQALRIVVNKELENIKSLLSCAPKILNSGGRLVCISFHSLEDRLVKQTLQEQRDYWNILTKQVITPAAQELAENPSARSARLRAAERK